MSKEFDRLARDTAQILSSREKSFSPELYLAPIDHEPKYVLVDNFRFHPNSMIYSIELYEHKADKDFSYVRVYLQPNGNFVPSFVIAADKQAERMARREMVEPRSLDDDVQWIEEFNEFIVTNGIFSDISPLYFLRKCSFILDEMFSFISQKGRVYRAKNYVNLLNVGAGMEYFTHLTSADERSEISGDGHFGLIVSNSDRYVRQNTRYNWSQVNKEE